MSNSPPPDPTTHRRCDSCNEQQAIIYCRADDAKLCLSCDREIHSTNPLFTKHTRSLLCDSCDSSPATIFCSTDAVLSCQNCDWESHKMSSSSESHDRRPLEGFSGCPSVDDLLSVFGFQDFSKKGVLLSGGGDDGFGSGYGFSGGGGGVWESQCFVKLDDLIVSSGGDHSFQAMGVPPLPKNRNAAFGRYKEELLHQLRELAKSEPNVDDPQDIIKTRSEFLPTQNFQLEGRSSGFEDTFEEKVNMSYETNSFQWCPDGSDPVGQEFFSDQFVGHNNSDVSCIVPDGSFDNIDNSSHIDLNHQVQSHHSVAENTQVVHGINVRELNTQEREIALTRYKEKKKTRRYDKQIRYVSRKVRAESRTRIRGRFAKMDK